MSISPFADPRPARPLQAVACALVLAAALLLLLAVAAASAPAAGSAEVRPYDERSPWNTPIGANPEVDAGPLPALLEGNLPLTSDPDQYALPIYPFDRATPRHSVRMDGFFSSYDAGDDSRVGHGFEATIPGVPVPAGAVSSAGSDGQIIIWDPVAGVEYGFWQFSRDASGAYTATNGYRTHTTAGYHGRFADGRAGRGAGTTYLAGLVRPWEIARGRIDHALAFAYDSPSSAFVFPASKSDGGGRADDLAEGSRLQLDPALTQADFAAWGLSPAARVIARALQTYGMYVIDSGGSSKIFLEDRTTAGWDPSITRDLTRAIPMSAFRVVARAGDPGAGGEPGTPGAPPEASDPGAGTPPGCAGPRGSAATAEARSIASQLTRRLRRARAARLRARVGLRLMTPTRSRSTLRVSVVRRAGGRRIVLSSGVGTARCGDTAVRLKPTAAGRRWLRGGRRVVVELRLRPPAGAAPQPVMRALRLAR